jgi:hypothetical protein
MSVTNKLSMMSVVIQSVVVLNVVAPATGVVLTKGLAIILNAKVPYLNKVLLKAPNNLINKAPHQK